MVDQRHWIERWFITFQSKFAVFWENENQRLGRREENQKRNMEHQMRMAALQKEIDEGWRFPPVRQRHGRSRNSDDGRSIIIQSWYEYLDPRDDKWHPLECSPAGHLLVPSFKHEKVIK